MIVNKRSIYFARLFSDLILLNIAFVVSAILAQSLETLLDRNKMFVLLIGLNFIWYFFASLTNFYDQSGSKLFTFHIVDILKNVAVQTIVSIIFIFIVKEDLFTRNFIVYNSIVLFCFISIRSFSFRLLLKTLRKKGYNIRNVLIVGSGEVAVNFKNLLIENPDFGYRFLGFLSDRDESGEIIGGYDQLEDIIASKNINEVIIALPGKDNFLLDNIIRICNRNAVRTHIIPDYFKFISKRFQISMMGNFPIITSRNEPLDEAQWRFIKRTFDIIFSFIITICLLIILVPIIAIITKLTSGGPVFFVQERIGARNKKFRCYKFRTLHENNYTDSDFQPVTKNDPRVTSFGRFLRISNIDELPQFINVLKGEMSVVGPRPHAVPYDDKYGKIVEEIKLRHNVKPGITGWAQIHGLRGDVEDEEENKRRTIRRIEHDLWYIENWSFWLDIQIIIQTIWQMLKGKTKAV